MGYLEVIERAERAYKQGQSDQPLASTLVGVSSEPGCRPVYWESMDGTILGPGRVLSVTQDGREFWLCLAYDRFLYWIRDGLLRSEEAFKEQKHWACSCCQGTDYWASPYRTRICRICHPPVLPEGEKEHVR